MITRSESIFVGLIFLFVIGLGIKYWPESEMREVPVAVIGEQVFDEPDGLEPTLPRDEVPQWVMPLERAKERVTKKSFGIRIDPLTSPVQPERFRGYHTGVDFEVLADEVDETITVSAVCEGEIVEKRRVSGYGGLVIQKCMYEDKPLLVIYGHLALSSVTADIEDDLVPGEPIGVLGESGSRDTDGERKHLHLGFFRGDTIDFRGYVTRQSELSSWFDPCLFVCQ